MTQVYISVGSNIEPQCNVRSALTALRAQFGSLEVSPVYRSRAVGFSGDDFLNLVVGCQTSMTIEAMRALLRRIEEQHGRVRGGEKFAARPLDLDLLIYGEEVRGDQDMRLPHPDITKYAFVLQPLVDLAAGEVHPELGIDFGTLWTRSSFASAPLQRVFLREETC